MNHLSKMDRRAFMGAAVSAAYAVNAVPNTVFGATAPSNKLNVAQIGVGGMGAAGVHACRGENVVALCDVDPGRASNGIKTYPQARFFRDFRVMFDKMAKEIDAVYIATPDHTHFIAAMAAIQRGKHVYCEKPLAHSIYEVRQLTEAARHQKVQTQMGNQGHSSEYIRLCKEWVAAGVIGQVREVHAWSNRPSGGYAFPSSIGRPTDTPPVPENLDWELWQGPVKKRPYHPVYAPILWRGWLDYGTGALGDMGCHILDPSFWALNLGNPTSVEANVSYSPGITFWQENLKGKTGNWLNGEIRDRIAEMQKETYPAAAKIVYEFPERDGFAPCKLTWYDGGMLPENLPGIDIEPNSSGAIMIGDKGYLRHGSHGASGLEVHPTSLWNEFLKDRPPKTHRRIKDHRGDWLEACKGGLPASSNFDYGGPLTEMVLMGVIATRVPNHKLLWDDTKMAFENSDAANALIKPEFHNGWTL